MCEYRFHKFACGHFYRSNLYRCGKALRRPRPEHGCGQITRIHGTERLSGKCPQCGGGAPMQGLEKRLRRSNIVSCGDLCARFCCCKSPAEIKSKDVWIPVDTIRPTGPTPPRLLIEDATAELEGLHMEKPPHAPAIKAPPRCVIM